MHDDFRSKRWPGIRIGVAEQCAAERRNGRAACAGLDDAVNLASRLALLTKEFGADIIVGEETKKRRATLAFGKIDRIRVKGRHAAVAIFEPLGFNPPVPGWDGAFSFQSR